MKKLMMMVAMLAVSFAMQAQTKFHDVEANEATGPVKCISTTTAFPASSTNSLIFYLRLRPIHQEQLFRSTSKSGIKPVDIIGREHLVGHIPLIEIDMRPLTTLRLMTGDGIGELHLQGVVVTVFSS